MKKFNITFITTIFIIYLIQFPAYAITEASGWWNKYGDDILIENLNILYAKNQDLKIAAYKTKQMQDVVKMSFSKQLPQLSFMGDINHTFSSADFYYGNMRIPSYNQTNFLLPLTLNYEIDIWGKNYLATKSVKQELKIAEQDEYLMKLIVESNFASCYFNLVKVDELLKNQSKIIKIQTKIVSMIEKKYKTGLANKSDVIREKQLLSDFIIVNNNLLEKQELLQNQLYTMLGDKNGEKVKRSSIDTFRCINPPKDINAEVIADRPDYIKSEFYVKKIGYDVRVAKRDFLPKFTFYGNVGFNLYSNSLPQSTFLSNLGVIPQLDIFSGGLKLARYRYTKNEAKKALEMYEKTILTSMQEINDALYQMKTADKDYRENIKNNQLETEKYNLVTKKYQIGATSYLHQIVEERNTYIAKNRVIASKIDYLISSVGLYKALGGKNVDSL